MDKDYRLIGSQVKMCLAFSRSRGGGKFNQALRLGWHDSIKVLVEIFPNMD